MRNYVLILLFAGILSPLQAQIGGTNTFDFLSLPSSARIVALGGEMVAIADGDLNLAFQNPSLLTEESDQQLGLSYVNYIDDISFGFASYAKNYGKLGTLALGINYFSYGTFNETLPTGEILGSFKSSDYALNIAWGFRLDSSFSVGAIVKPIYSTYERYNSFGMAMDVGASYRSSDHLFAAGLVFRNMGSQFKGYTPKSFEPLPFDIQLGVSQRLEYAPFRFTLLYHHLHKFDMTYEKEDETKGTDVFGESNSRSKLDIFGDKLMRHFILGVEFIPMKNFNLRLAYNYQKRKEMQINSRAGMVGFSWGFGIKISKFNLSYGRGIMHLAGASNYFTVNTSLSDFF